MKGQERKKWGKNNIYSFYIHLDHDLQDLSLRNKEAPHSDKKRKKALKMSPLNTYNNCYYVNLWHIILFKRYDEHASTFLVLKVAVISEVHFRQKNPLASPRRLMLIVL